MLLWLQDLFIWKGSIQFPLDKPLPYELVTRIVKARMDENSQKAEPKSNQKTAHRRQPGESKS